MFNLHKNWMELLFVFLMVFGIIIALLAPSAVISYFMILVAGLFAGRLIYGAKDKLPFPYLIIIGGFLMGYIIGAYYGSRIISVALFVLGAVLSYRSYDKGILKDVKF